MKYYPPYGSTDPDASYVDKDVPGAVRGSAVPAKAIEKPQREIVDFLTKSGLAPSDGLQLGQAVQTGKVNSAVAGGTANAITATFSPAVLLLIDGLTLRVRASAANTNVAPTFTPNSGVIDAAPIKKGANLNLTPGDITGAGYWMDLTYDLSSNVWVLKNPSTGVTPQQLQSIVASVASNALTFSYSGGNLSFRSASLTNGLPTSVSLGPTSLTIPSGATLGISSGVLSQVVLLALYNNGSPVLGVAYVTPSGVLNLDETGLVSSVAMSAGASAANTVYSAAAISNTPFRVLGYAALTEATAGIWATPPSLVQPMGAMTVLNFLANSPGFAASANVNGYQRLPSGLILQWGLGLSGGAGARSQSITLPIAFPTGGLEVVATDTGNSCISYGASFISASQFTAYVPASTFGTSSTPVATGSCQFRWIAIGA